MILTSKLLKEIKESNSNLIQIDDEINFQQGQTTMQQTVQKSFDLTLYDFNSCKVGDVVYYDETLGYNLLQGEPIAECCIEKDEYLEDACFHFIDKKYDMKICLSSFSSIPPGRSKLYDTGNICDLWKYREDTWYLDADGFSGTVNLFDSKFENVIKYLVGLKSMVKNDGKMKCQPYVPSLYELYKSVDIFWNNPTVIKYNNYGVDGKKWHFWTSTRYSMDKMCIINIETDPWGDVEYIPDAIEHTYKDAYIHPFIKFMRGDNELNESNNNLLQFGDEIEFSQSDNTIQTAAKKGIDAMYGFENCQPGDELYFDETYGYNLLHGDLVAICCAAKGELDGYPRFSYKHDVGGKYRKSVAFVLDSDGDSLSFESDKEEINSIFDELENLALQGQYNSKCGYSITQALANSTKISSNMAFETINAGDNTLDSEYLYVPTTNELACMLSNGIHTNIHENTLYITCSYWIEEIDGEMTGNYEVLSMNSSYEGDDIDDIINSASDVVDMTNGQTYYCRPFFYIKKLIDEQKNKKINEAANIIQFDDNIEFAQSSGSMKRATKKAIDLMYGFDKVQLGDILYKHPTCGYNLIAGTEVGECCVEPGVLDDMPRFWSVSDEYPGPMMFGNDYDIVGTENCVPGEDWGEDVNGIARTEFLRKKGYNVSFYIDEYGPNYYFPAVGELIAASNNNEYLKYKLNPEYYWTSTLSEEYNLDGSHLVYICYVYGNGEPTSNIMRADGGLVTDEHSVRLFIKPNNTKPIKESSLLQMNDIEFDNSTSDAMNQKVVNDVKNSILESCKVGDRLYKVGPYKYQIRPAHVVDLENNNFDPFDKGEIGICCIPARDGYGPRFISKDSDSIPSTTLLPKTVMGYNRPNTVQEYDGYELTKDLLRNKSELALLFDSLSKANKIDFYIPSAIEMKLARNNVGEKNKDIICYTYRSYLNGMLSIYLWTSSEHSGTYGLYFDPCGNHVALNENYNKHKALLFINVTPESLVPYNGMNESSLLQMNDVEFDQSNQIAVGDKNTKETIGDIVLSETNVKDLLCTYKDGYVIYKKEKDPSGKLRKKLHCIGQCIASASEMADGRPRFMAIDDFHSKEGFAWWDNGEYSRPSLANLKKYGTNDKLEDINGYENTHELIKDIHHVAARNSWVLFEEFPDFYLPAAGELQKIYEHNIGYAFTQSWWTSTQCDRDLAWYMDRLLGIRRAEKNNKFHILPFIHVNPKKVYIGFGGGINESSLLQIDDGTDINFEMSNQKEFANNHTKETVGQFFLDNIKTGDLLWAYKDGYVTCPRDLTMKEFQKKYKSVKCIGECVASGLEMDDGQPRFMALNPKTSTRYYWDRKNYPEPVKIPKYDHSNKIKDINGYENTQELIKNRQDHEAASMADRAGVLPDFYLPAAGELKILEKLSKGIMYTNSFWTSTQAGSSSAWYMDRNFGLRPAQKNDKYAIIPFIHVDPKKLYDAL